MTASLIGAIGATACGDHDHEPQPDPQRQRRVIEPPTGTVRPLPPHAIRADGVGPYRLGEALDQLLKLLPSGPRIALFDIPGVVHRSIVRAEDDTVLIGGEPLAPASFVAVVGSEVARTESGIHVGSSKDELVRALGAPATDPEHARDPRLLVPSSLRNLRAVLDGDRVAALVVLDDADPRRAHPSAPAAPPPLPPPPPRDSGIVAAAPAAPDPCPRPVPAPPADAAESPALHFGACLTATGELIDVNGEDVAVRAPDGDRPIATVHVPGLQFAAALRADAETGRDELIAITRVDEPQLRTWSLSVYHLDGNRLVRVVEPTQLYQLSTANARWIGAELRGLDLYLELTSHVDTIEAGGLLTIRFGDKMRDVVVISSALVARRHGKPTADPVDTAPEPGDAGTSDAHR